MHPYNWASNIFLSMATCKVCMLAKLQTHSLSSLITIPHKQNVYETVLRNLHSWKKNTHRALLISYDFTSSTSTYWRTGAFPQKKRTGACCRKKKTCCTCHSSLGLLGTWTWAASAAFWIGAGTREDGTEKKQHKHRSCELSRRGNFSYSRTAASAVVSLSTPANRAQRN